MRLVLGRLADLLGDVAQRMDQLVEFAGDARQLRHDVAVREGPVADAALADFGGDVAEAAQAEANADGGQDGDQREDEVDHRSHPHLAGFPVGAADRGVEELRGRVRRGEHPAAARRADRNDGCEELDGAVGLPVADFVGGVPGAGV